MGVNLERKLEGHFAAETVWSAWSGWNGSISANTPLVPVCIVNFHEEEAHSVNSCRHCQAVKSVESLNLCVVNYPNSNHGLRINGLDVNTSFVLNSAIN